MPRSIPIEQNAIGVFQKQNGKLPNSPQDWGQVQNIAYPNNTLPDELKSTTAYSYYQGLQKPSPTSTSTSPTTPAPIFPQQNTGIQQSSPMTPDASGHIPLQQLQQNVQNATANNTAAIGEASQPAFSVLQEALKAKTGTASTGIGTSDLYQKAGLTGMPVLQSSLAQTGQELTDSRAFFNNAITNLAGAYKTQAQQAQFSYNAAVDAYNTESARLQAIANAATAHKYELDNIMQQNKLAEDLVKFKNANPDIATQIQASNMGGTISQGQFVPSGQEIAPGGGLQEQTSGMRTDRHNNPTAMTTDVAKTGGLIEGVDYVKGDPFTTSDGKTLYTAKFLGDPIAETIKAIDKMGFYTQSGAQRWSHTAMPKNQWDNLTPDMKRDVVASMYTKEGGSGSLLTGKTATTQSTNSNYATLGLLTNTDFKASNPIDQQAKRYLDIYIKNATMPTNAALGISRTNTGLLNQVASRASQLYSAATGSSLPDLQILKSNKVLISGNNKLLNNLGVQENTVAKNFDLAISKMGKKTNNNIPVINNLLNPILQQLGDPDVQAYFASNLTLQNEAASLLALKNASGTTVYDKMESAGLIPKNATADQQKAIIQRLKDEANNARSAIIQQSQSLYSQIDPLEQLTQNPTRQSKIGGGSNSSTNVNNDPLGIR